MASIILPYPNLGETISVNLDLDKIPHKKTGLHSILADASKLGSSVSISIDVQLPGGITDVFPPSERKAPPLDVLAAAISRDGGVREPIPLKRQKASLYTGTINLDLTRIKEAVRVNVYAIRTANSSQNGFARWSGSRLAWAPVHEIRFTERPAKGDFLRVLWEDFENSAIVPPHYEEAMHYIDANSEPPVLYLNKKTTNPLIKLIDTQGSGHAKAFPRDLVHRTIAANAWLTLAQFALNSLHDEALNASGPVDLEEALGGSWKKEMIELLLPELYPNLDPEDALLELCTNIGITKYYENAILRATLGIQVRHEIKEQYEKFAGEIFKNG
jgi:hypothetical protein